MIFGRFPPGTTAADFGIPGIRMVRDAGNLDPSSLDLVTLKTARALLLEKKVLENETVQMNGAGFRDLLLEVPEEVVRLHARAS